MKGEYNVGKIIWGNNADIVFNSWVKDMLKFDQWPSIYKVSLLYAKIVKLEDAELVTDEFLDADLTNKSYDEITEREQLVYSSSDTYYIDIDHMFRDIAKTIQYFIEDSSNFTLLRDSWSDRTALKFISVREEDTRVFPFSDKAFSRYYTFFTFYFQRYEVINQGFCNDPVQSISDIPIGELKLYDPLHINNIYRVQYNGKDNYITGGKQFTIDELAELFKVDYNSKIISLNTSKINLAETEPPKHKCRTWNDAIKTVI